MISVASPTSRPPVRCVGCGAELPEGLLHPVCNKCRDGSGEVSAGSRAKLADGVLGTIEEFMEGSMPIRLTTPSELSGK